MLNLVLFRACFSGWFSVILVDNKIHFVVGVGGISIGVMDGCIQTVLLGILLFWLLPVLFVQFLSLFFSSSFFFFFFFSIAHQTHTGQKENQIRLGFDLS